MIMVPTPETRIVLRCRYFDRTSSLRHLKAGVFDDAVDRAP
jgi:hypothetical protein